MTLAELLKDVKITAVQYPGAGRRESWQDSMIGTLPGGDIRAVATDPEDAVRNGLFLCASQDPEQIRAQVSAAQAAGARCALVAEFTERDILQLRCADMRQATAFVFANFHGNPQKKLRVIGVTGTNGKTTTTTLIRHILRSLDRSCGLIGTNGDAVGANPSSTGYTTPIPQILFAEMARAVESGCEFLTTQMFFDNNILYNYMFKLLRHDIRVPVIAGIMPVTNAKQIKRIMSLSSSSMPTRFKAIVDRFANNPEAMKQAGIAYATEQIIDLIANDVTHIHIYTMNRPDIAGSIMTNLSKIIDGYEAE